MVRAVARFLHGRPYPALGMFPGPAAKLLERCAPSLDRLPSGVRRTLYVRGGWLEAIPARRAGSVEGERIAGYLASQYPDRRYQAAVVGSSSGALVHLCAALGAPFLPQTVLVPVRHPGLHPDEPRDGLEAMREPARQLLDANPSLQLHHMHDPNQDRLMLERMTYFRVKRRLLGAAYGAFLSRVLPRGATLLVSECTLTWPVTRLSERHVFQFGALGGASAEEMHGGSARVAAMLERCGSHRRSWDPPQAGEEAPEAEWGFEQALLDDLHALADARGWRIVRIRFALPDALSEPVADLYRAWYRRRGLSGDRLLAESFILLDPWWALRLGAVPLWLTFPVEQAAERLERYLARQPEPYREVLALLFSHGVDSVGLAPIERWQRHARLIGVDAATFPRDYAAFLRYETALRDHPARHELPQPLALADVESFLAARDDIELIAS